MQPYKRLILALITFAVRSASWCYKTQFAGKDQIKSIDFSTDGQYLLTSEISGRVLLWKFDTLQPIRSYQFGNVVQEAVISKDMTKIAVAGDNDDVKILDFNTFAVIKTISTGHGYVYDVDFRYDDDKLLTCGDDKKIKAWDTSGGWAKDLDKRMNHQVFSCQYATDESMLAAGKHFVEVWKKNGGGGGNNVQQTAEFHDDGDNFFWGLRARHTGTGNLYLIAACENGTVLQMAFDQSSQTTWTTSIASLFAVGYSFDDTYFALTGSSSRVLMYNATNRVNILQQSLQTNSTSDLVSARFSYDSNYFATGNRNGTVYLYSRFCIGCAAGTYKNDTQCRPCYLDLQACAICINSTICKACNEGYYLNGNSCSSCDVMEGCAHCKTTSICTSCLPGFHLNGVSCDRCYSDIPGCIQCNDSSTCLQCDNRYALVSGDCELCSEHIDNCVYCNSTGYCEQCTVGYYENSGSCDVCGSDCLVCQAVDNCTVCAIKHYISSVGLCVDCSEDACIACNSTDHCLDCEQDHYVNSTYNCAACEHPCQSCNSSTYCLSCVVGYYQSADGVCTNCPSACLSCNTTIYCSSCDSGYYLDTTTHTCIQCHQVYPQCRHCNSTHCLDCEPGTLLQSDGSCSYCIDQIPNCMICSNNTICRHCIIGYYPTGLAAIDSCAQCQPGCRSCQNSTECSVCEPGYYFLNAQCYLCLDQCYTCEDANTCLSCREGLYLSGTTCQYCKDHLDNCHSCLTNTVCLTCQIGYTLTAPNTCSPCTHPCSSCEGTVNNCKTCAIGYFYSANTCTLCHSNCTECGNAIDDCTACAIGYYLSAPDCLPCSIDGCSICISSSQCLQCRSGFFSQSDGSCLSCSSPISQCLQCSTDGTLCFLCQYGYFLASSDTACDSCSINLSNCEHCSAINICESCVVGFFVNASSQCQMCGQGCYSCLDGTTCEVCIDSYTLSGVTCYLCETSITGCHLCSSTTTCTNCLQGFHLSAGSCSLCADDLVGCQACISPTHCTLCSVFYELDSTSNQCIICSDLYTDCQTCFNGQCMECQVGSYLDGGLCYNCQNMDVGCIHCDSNSVCTQCMNGYQLVGVLCRQCDVSYPHCIYCSSSACEQCESGYYISSNTCHQCNNEGCQICLPDDPTKCLTCNSRYYLNVDICELCSTHISECMQCNDPLICTECSHGFYLNSTFQCQLCSDLYDGCSTCTTTSCLDCLANFFLQTSSTPHICIPCTDYLSGCAFCSSSSVCLSCQNGFYISGNTCESCTYIDNCLYCTDSTTCTYCSQSFYLHSSQCYLCADAIPGCYACQDSVTCTSCQGHFELISGQCVQIEGEVVQQMTQLTLQSYYQDENTLKHVLSSRQNRFVQVEHDWTVQSGLWLIDDSYKQIVLTIKDVYWSKDSYDMVFLTNNPISQQLQKSMKNMPFLGRKGRLLHQIRLLPQASLDLSYQFKIMLTQQAIHNILPKLDHLGDLYLDYPMEDPQFYRSYIKNQPYYQYIFGLTITIILFLLYFIKAVCILPESKNKGQIVPHIFAIKCGGLALYPTYGEFINYCYGFMMADFPFFNQSLGNALGRDDDVIPPPHAMYYVNLSITSTYFLATLIIVFLWFAVAVLGYLKKSAILKVNAVKQFVYNFFNMGAIMAGCLSLEGALLNPIASFTIGSTAYIVGILMYIAIFVDIVYSIAIKNALSDEEKKKDGGMADNFHKLRVFIKGSILAVLHLNPLYFFIALFCLQISAILIDYFLHGKEKQNPKLQLLQHVLINIGLGMILCVPNAMLGLVVVSVLIVAVLMVDIYINWQQYKLYTKNKNGTKISDDQIAQFYDHKDITEIGLSIAQEKKNNHKTINHKLAQFDNALQNDDNKEFDAVYERRSKKKKGKEQKLTFMIGEIQQQVNNKK